VRVVVQRVNYARVRVARELVGQTGPGLLVLLGVARGDGPEDARRLASRVAHLRCFADATGRMNRSARELARSALLVSQFTLVADPRKGRRPSFDPAAEPALAERRCRLFVEELEASGVPAASGRFGAYMQVELENDGPVTFVLDAPEGGGASLPPPTGSAS